MELDTGHLTHLLSDKMIHGTENYISLIYWKYQTHRKIGHNERERRGKVTQLNVDGSVK